MPDKMFRHYDLEMVKPSFDSEVVNHIIDLDKLRDKTLEGSTHFLTFFQLKHIFHLLESLGSARIEGNNTTMSEYIDAELNTPSVVPESIREIGNIQLAMSFIEKNINESPINRIFISEIHKIVVNDLATKNEGDRNPGEYRKFEVEINNFQHIPPTCTMISSYMDELFNFINFEHGSKYDLLKIAIAHHRFAWIHPFGNGNGRTVRLLTYAMLIKMGFRVDICRILNPTAIFCNNRDIYYQKLSQADDGSLTGILYWCEYVLSGLKREIKKIDNLLNYDFLKNKILIPAINNALENEYITSMDGQILNATVGMQEIRASDLKPLFPGKSPSEISREIKRLTDKKKLLLPVKENARRYVICFDNNKLLRSIVWALGENGFLPWK